MATWPSISTASKLSEKNKKKQIKTEFEGGYVQSRAHWTREKRIFSMQWDTMTTTDKATLETFFEANLGGSFTWTHPGTSVAYTVRFKDDELIFGFQPTAYWRVKIDLEEI